MSGGPQVFLGATTFCSRCRQISGRRPVSDCRQISGRREALPLGAGVLVVPRVFRAPEAPAAREARASLRSAPRLEARPCPPVPPAPSTPVVPGVLMCGSVRRLEARPGPAGLASAFTHIAAALPQCRMQFPRDSFEP